MKYSTAITLTLATMATADWALYCGDSVSTFIQNYPTITNIKSEFQCTDGTLVASGSDAVESCASLGDTYDYCYILADSIYYVDWWKAIFTENIDCVISGVAGGRESNGLYNARVPRLGPGKVTK